MMKFKKLSILVIVLFIALLPSGLALRRTGKIAVIYNDTDTIIHSGPSFRNFLQNDGHSVDLINMTDILTTDLSDYDLILIDDHTGFLGSWGSTAEVNYVNNSGKPIIGIGDGGYAFFGKLNLDIGYDKGGLGLSDEVHITDPSHAIFNIRYTIQNGTNDIYDGISGFWGFLASTLPSNVTSYALAFDGSSLTALVSQFDRYFFWGYEDDPSEFTTTGEQLFLNVITYYLPPSSGDTIPSYNLTLILGMIALISMMIIIKKKNKFI